MRLGVLLAVVAACGDNGPDERELRQGGETTVEDRTSEAFSHPAQNLTDDEKFTWQLGRSPFQFTWAPPQLGRLFNHTGCMACHGGNGRGLPSIERGQDAGSQMLVRVSTQEGVPATPGGNIEVPGFGEQLQDHCTSGLPEVFIELAWQEVPVFYPDGTEQPMRRPRVTIQLPNVNEPVPAWMTSVRQGPMMIGLGLLDAIPEASLMAAEDPDDLDGDGISGRRNLVWDRVNSVTRTGRFGHKANVVTLEEQVASAFLNDIGLTNKMFPEGDGSRDLNDDQLDQATFFTSTIAVPAAAPRDAAATHGRELFDTFGCASCHTPSQTTGDHAIGALANQTIFPYTDLLLHDVGDLLTDARPDHLAIGVEWRTPPLWGIGLVQTVQPGTTFLHDGRARTLDEAILWHGGEAQPARDAFHSAETADRAALIAFLNTL